MIRLHWINFFKYMEQVKKHLAMVFHRFIENKKIKIFFQQREVEPWNPFLMNEQLKSFPKNHSNNGKDEGICVAT